MYLLSTNFHYLNRSLSSNEQISILKCTHSLIAPLPKWPIPNKFFSRDNLPQRGEMFAENV